MADAVGLTASLIALVATAYASYQRLHEISHNIRSVSSHIHAVSMDLDDVYLVQGPVQSLLDGDGFMRRASHLST